MDRTRMNGMEWDGMIWDRVVLLLVLTTTANCHHDWLTDWLTMLVPFVFTWPTTTATATTTTEMTMTTITMSDDKGGDVGDAKRLLTFTTNRWVDGSMWAFCWSYRCNFPELLRNDNMMAKVTSPRPVPSGLDLGLLMLWFWFVILWRFSFIHSCFCFGLLCILLSQKKP